MIIGRDLMVQLGLPSKLKRQSPQGGSVTIPMKEPGGIQGKPDLTSHEMSEVAIQTAKPVSTREDTERLVKLIDCTYAKADLKQVTDNATQLNAEERTPPPRIF